MRAIGRRARAAAAALARRRRPGTRRAPCAPRRSAVRDRREAILAANARDLAEARAEGLSAALIDRLALDGKRVEAMAQGLEDIAALPDPVGRELARWTRPNGLDIARIAVPLGRHRHHLRESRPNVTADAGGLCARAGNAAILRGGSESFHSSHAPSPTRCAERLARRRTCPADAMQLVPTRDRAAVGHDARAMAELHRRHRAARRAAR